MRIKERLINHGLIKLMLLVLVMLTPFTAWAQTTYQGGNYTSQGGDYTSNNGSWGDWTVTGTNVNLSSSGGSLMCYVLAGETSTIELSMTQTQNTSEKLCALTYSPGGSSYSLLSAKIVSIDNPTEYTDFTTQLKVNGGSRSFSATTPIDWGVGKKLVLTCQLENTTNTAVTRSISGATVTTGTPYDLVVDGIIVTTANKDCVTNSTTNWNGQTYVSHVSYDPTGGKLNLCKAVLTGPIQLGSSMNSLTIDINGESDITTTDAAAIIAESAASITFTTSSTGSLNLKRTDGTGLVGSNITLSYNAGLSAVIVAPTTASTLADATEATIKNSYNITVAGVMVTEANAGNITGDNISGTVSYDVENKILTLNNANITGNILRTNSDDLTVNLVGSNEITIANANDYVFVGNATEASPKLTLTTDKSAPGTLKVNGLASKTSIASGWSSSSSSTFVYASDGYPEDGDWWVQTHDTYMDIVLNRKYDLWIDGRPYCDANLDPVAGAKFVPEESTLEYGYHGTYSFTSSLPALKVKVTAEDAQMGTITFQSKGEVTSGTLTFEAKDADGKYSLSLSSNDGGPAISGFSSVNFTSPMHLTDPATVADLATASYVSIANYDSYNLQVGDINVTSLNADNILNDANATVKYNYETNTLTLNGASISGSIFFYQGPLNISLSGNNTLDANDGTAFSTETGGSLSFVTDESSPGQLLIKNATSFLGSDAIESQYDNGLTITLNNDGSKRLISTAPVLTPGLGLYWPDQQFAISGVGSTYTYADYCNYDGQHTYSEPFTLAAGSHYIVISQLTTVDGTDFTVEGIAHFVIHNKPTFSLEAGSYVGTQNVKIENLPSGLSANATDTPQVWYYLGEDSDHPVQYTSADQTIAVSESTKVSVYIIDNDSGKQVKSENVSANYTVIPNIADAYVDGLAESATYTAAAITPTFTLKESNAVDAATISTDNYDVSYMMVDYSSMPHAPAMSARRAPQGYVDVDEMVDAGEYVITITGKGAYGGTKKIDFTITKASLRDVTIDDIAPVTYNGGSQAPVLIVKLNGNEVAADEYDISYKKGSNNVEEGQIKDAGTYTATLTSTNKNFSTAATSTASTDFTIDQAEITAVELEKTNLNYNGEEQTPAIKKVWAGEHAVLEVTSDDYEITGGNAKTEKGDYELVVSAKVKDGNNFKGSAKVAWSIIGRLLKVGENGDVQFANGQKWASFYNTTTDDLYLPEGLMAYIVTAVNTSSATLKAINYVPKEVPLFLENESTTTTTNESAEGNLLQGTTAATAVSGISGTVYALHNNYLMKVTSGSIPANRAYLVLNSSAAPQLSLIIDGEGTTGIENGKLTIENSDSQENDVWFTLDGRRLQQKPTKSGLYIKNGSKVVVNNK